MLLRAFFALGLALMLLPHEPNLGLHPAAYSNISPIFARAQTELKIRLAAVASDMRNGINAPKNLSAADN
ncbi:hypothetical protein FHS83_002660 [Rhizomicrobium palustre]|uniref:Uncharacterized protein n=1 Tax=Rhizomicrobium palustre TaxID=189966 RepID=A0A846N294_9PROT|nr:hypothetical protein [Rhizomicrobium palustre]